MAHSQKLDARARDGVWLLHMSALLAPQGLGGRENMVAMLVRSVTAHERRGKNIQGFEEFYLEAKAGVWP